MTENELKRIVLVRAYARGWSVYHHPMTTVRGSQGKGYPDLTLARRLIDADPEILFIELKQDKGKLTEDQERWGWMLSDRWHVIRPADIHDATLERLLL